MKTQLKLKAKIKTKSNFRNLNNTYLPVFEIEGTRITCSMFDNELQKNILVDFNIKEILSFENN